MQPFDSLLRFAYRIGFSSLTLNSHHQDENQSFLDDGNREKEPPRISHPRTAVMPWMISTWLLALVSIISISLNFTAGMSKYHIGDALLSEMLDARQAIYYEQKRYTGELTYDTQSQKVIRIQDGDMEFFGPPSAEIDAAWDSLLKDEFPIMTDREAMQFLPDLKRQSDNHFHFEPDFSHNLHCLNAIRKHISGSLYPETPLSQQDQEYHNLSVKIIGPEWDRIHLEHCMDRIRQSILCQADLTPSPLYSWDGFAVSLGKTGQRTCRKWEPIKEWLDNRRRVGKNY